MTILHARMAAIDASGIRKVFDKAAALRDPINLSIGQPDLDVPDPVKEAAVEAIRAGRNRYTVTQGIAPLREALRARLAARNGVRVAPEGILVTSGVSGGLLLAFLALFGPGDEVLIPDPYFVMYKHLLRLLGATPVFVDTYPDFRFRPEALERVLTPRTKGVVLGSPANPTGAVTAEADLRGIVEICRARGLILVSDEIYEAFVYDEPHRSPGAWYDRVVTLGGFSKSHALTGWRLGWAAGPVEVVEAMTTLQQYSFVCAPAPFQEAALAALDVDPRPWAEAYRRKRDLLLGLLSDRFRVRGAQGAFYLFLEAPGGSGTAFCERALERNLLVIPGGVFSERDTHVRISYAASDETLRRGAAILNDLAAGGR